MIRPGSDVAVYLCREPVDMRKFFDSMDHDWTIRFLEHRIADKRLLRLIVKWLKVGSIEDDRRVPQTRGAPQGAVISPILANVYLHYVYDLWAHQWRQRHADGDMAIIRYADDTVLGFQHRSTALAFRQALEGRLERFGLALHPDKTRLLEFGRYAERRRARRGEGNQRLSIFWDLPTTAHELVAAAGLSWAVGRSALGYGSSYGPSSRGCGEGCTATCRRRDGGSTRSCEATWPITRYPETDHRSAHSYTAFDVCS